MSIRLHNIGALSIQCDGNPEECQYCAQGITTISIEDWFAGESKSEPEPERPPVIYAKITMTLLPDGTWQASLLPGSRAEPLIVVDIDELEAMKKVWAEFKTRILKKETTA